MKIHSAKELIVMNNYKFATKLSNKRHVKNIVFEPEALIYYVTCKGKKKYIGRLR